MNFLTPSQINELLGIVDKYSITFLAHTVGTDILTKEDKRLLQSVGVSVKDINNATTNTAQAFKFGMLSMALGSSAKTMTYDQFKKYLSSGKFFPLSEVEQAALNRVKYSMGAELKRLSGNMKSDIERKIVVIDQGKAIHSGTVLSATQKAIEDRKSVGQLALEIGELTGQWNRDLGKIADYVMHEAFNEGRVAQINKGTGKVYFDVYPGACKYCVKAYLTGGIGSEPKIFTLKQLRDNGTNIGKKPDAWQATISGVHPFCRCTANEFEEGYIWDPVTRTFTIPDPNRKRKVERKSKVGVTVNGKTTVI